MNFISHPFLNFISDSIMTKRLIIIREPNWWSNPKDNGTKSLSIKIPREYWAIITNNNVIKALRKKLSNLLLINFNDKKIKKKSVNVARHLWKNWIKPMSLNAISIDGNFCETRIGGKKLSPIIGKLL